MAEHLPRNEVVGGSNPPRRAATQSRINEVRNSVFWLGAFANIYMACCLACRHTAVRIGADGRATCDWCSIAASEALWRFEGGQLIVRGRPLSF